MVYDGTYPDIKMHSLGLNHKQLFPKNRKMSQLIQFCLILLKSKIDWKDRFPGLSLPSSRRIALAVQHIWPTDVCCGWPVRLDLRTPFRTVSEYLIAARTVSGVCITLHWLCQ